MRTGQTPLWLLPVCCAIGSAVAYAVVSGLEDVYERRRQLARAAAEIGVVGGVLYWYIALRPEVRATLSPISVLTDVAFTVVVWSIVAWPFTMWELERRLHIPYHRSYDITAKVCGTTLLLFLIITGVQRVLIFL